MPGRAARKSGRNVQESERNGRPAGRECDISGRTRAFDGRRRRLTQRASGNPFRDDNPGMKIFLCAIVCAGLAVTACTSRATTPSGPSKAPSPAVNPPQLAPTRQADTEPRPEPAVTPRPALASAANRQEGFAKSVRPILAAHCAPCHEPGGKMYDRLPFDRAETIASHRDAVLRRLKGDDRAAVAGWLDQVGDHAAAASRPATP